MSELTNRSGHDEFDELLGHVLDDLDDGAANGYDVRTDPFWGYRQLHARSPVNRDTSPRRESAPAGQMNGTIARINLLVDLQNLVSSDPAANQCHRPSASGECTQTYGLS